MELSIKTVVDLWLQIFLNLKMCRFIKIGLRKFFWWQGIFFGNVNFKMGVKMNFRINEKSCSRFIKRVPPKNRFQSRWDSRVPPDSLRVDKAISLTVSVPVFDLRSHHKNQNSKLTTRRKTSVVQRLPQLGSFFLS